MGRSIMEHTHTSKMFVYQREEQRHGRVVVDSGFSVVGLREDFTDFILLDGSPTLLLCPEWIVDHWRKEVVDLGADVTDFVRIGLRRRSYDERPHDESHKMMVSTLAEWIAAAEEKDAGDGTMVLPSHCDRLFIDLSDPAADPLPVNLPPPMVGIRYVWCLLGRYSTPAQRRWAYRSVSSARVMNLESGPYCRQLPKIFCMPMGSFWSDVVPHWSYLRNTWIVAHGNVEAVRRRLSSVLPTASIFVGRELPPADWDAPNQLVPRFHIAELRHILVKDCGDECVVVVEAGDDAAGVVDAMTPVINNGFFRGYIFVIYGEDAPEDLTHPDAILSLLPTRKVKWSDAEQ